MPVFFELVDPLRQPGLSSAGRSHQENRIARANGDLLDPLDQLIELLIPGRDPRLEKGQRFLMFLLKARCQFVVLGEVEIDDFVRAVCA